MRDPVEWKVSKKPFRDADARLVKVFLLSPAIKIAFVFDELMHAIGKLASSWV